MKLIKKPNQQGLGLLEWLLLLIILILLAFIAWYVFVKGSDTKNKLGETSQVNSQPAKTTKYFEFKEYGVKIVQSDELKNLSYTPKQIQLESGTTTTLYLNDSALAKSIDGCNTTKGSDGNFAAITKFSGQYPANPTPDIGGLLKQFDTFYISSSYPNGVPCSDTSKEDAVVAQMQALQKALSEAFKTAQEIK